MPSHREPLRIQFVSDLHLEVHPELRIAPAPGADLLVLAGDIGSYQSGSLLRDLDFGLARFAPAHGWPVPVLFVPGNHEYDGFDWDDAHARLRALCAELGITWLERATAVLGGVRFVGTTLWSDFDALANTSDEPDAAKREKQRAKAQRAADYYLAKTGTTRHGAPFLAPQVREQSLACQAWLRAALAEPFDGPTVAVTHFAPTLQSADPRYGRVPGTAGFCNALDALLPQATAWIHGHLHAQFDYRHDPSGCRVRANPLGYARKNEQAGFDPQAMLAVERY